MKRRVYIIALGVLLSFILSAVCPAESTLPKSKQNVLGHYLTAPQAYKMWQADGNHVQLLDVRTPEEYIFVGHVAAAHNIPLRFFYYKNTARGKRPALKDNPNFVAEVRKKFKTSDTILIICRSGHRSAAAVNLLAAAGFNKVYSITDGFEGDKVKDPASYFNGQRHLNGWRNAGAPWTYKLNAAYMYIPPDP